MRRRRALLQTVTLLSALLLPRPAPAAGCAPIAAAAPRVWTVAAVEDAVQITFLGHASFLLASPGGVTAVTDYNGVNVPAAPPDIATMNHAHSLHYTDTPDPRIAHVLRGWREDGGAPSIDLTVGDIHVSNLPTNIRDGTGGTERYGNSIFVFETAGLCIAHLSHLHHRLSPPDIAALGHIDVVMAPADGAYTLSLPDLMTVLDQIQPRVVLPMHWFMRGVLDRFLAQARAQYAIDVRAGPTLRISRATLPDQPTVIALGAGD
jgi:L-ascorbate metabolism protein UlaG (beta-lactamase superfamily)